MLLRAIILTITLVDLLLGKATPLTEYWVYCDYGVCKCGEILGTDKIVECRVGKNLSVATHNCVTYNKESQVVEIGKCIYNTVANSTQTILPIAISELDEFVCGKLYNRTGTLCGKCKDGHYPLAYSFDVKCIPCPDSKVNWWKYVLAAYLPLTLFYLFVLIFRVNVASSSLMYPFVCYAQGVSFPSQSRMHLLYVRNEPLTKAVGEWVLMIYGVWNLDFFRSFDLGICLGTDTMQTLALDIAVGVYPLLLMFLTYILIQLHDRNFKPVLLIWKPFQTLLRCFQGNVQIRTRTTLIDAFCTFFFLSNTKLMSASIDILVPVPVHKLNSTGHSIHSWQVFNDATIPYFGSQHLPYAILAVGVLSLFALLPVVILTVYPFKWFQRFLNLFPVRWYILHTFVDAFQGAYKDGTEPGTRDCRWFSSTLFTARYIMILIGVSTYDSTYYPLAAIVLVITMILLVWFQPFKQNTSHLTNITIAFMFFLALVHVAALGTSLSQERSTFMAIIFVILALPLIYISAIVLHWFYKNKMFGVRVVSRLQGRRDGYETIQ